MYIYMYIYIYMYMYIYIYIKQSISKKLIYSKSSAKLVVSLCVVCFVPLLHILTFKLLILALLIFNNKTLSYDFGK